MKSNKYNPDLEFAKRIKDALEFYGLEEGDLGKLIGTSGSDIKKIINMERSLGLKRANRISTVFNMKYYEFGNPNVPFLDQDDLPKRTFDVINERKENGPSSNEIDTELKLPIRTMEVLKNLDAKAEFTSNSIHTKLPEEIRSKVETNRITVLFKTGSLNKYVEYAKRKEGVQHVFKFISADSKIKMEEALKKQKEKLELAKKDGG